MSLFWVGTGFVYKYPLRNLVTKSYLYEAMAEAMEYTIFYSWQSDSDRSINRDFIRAALEDAAAAIRQGAQVEDFPRIDSGMENQSGSPEIAAVMFKKIRDSAIFVGDVTLVGTIPPRGRGAAKRVPNPNVSLEMGYAAGRLGYERIIGVMNLKNGRPEEQPIDARNKRFPITYRLDSADQADATEVKARLAAELKEAIQDVVECEYLAVNDAIKRLDVNCIAVIHSAGNMPRFHVPRPGTVALGSSSGIDTLVLAQAIPRLLDLNIIACFFNDIESSFGYEWTYFGKRVLATLRMGPNANTRQESSDAGSGSGKQIGDQAGPGAAFASEGKSR
jgi:hypothetical protein